jgi:hypothetical protein
VPPYVALHPSTLSVYHRAQKRYGAASAVSVVKGENPDALRICTVEVRTTPLRDALRICTVEVRTTPLLSLSLCASARWR